MTRDEFIVQLVFVHGGTHEDTVLLADFVESQGLFDRALSYAELWDFLREWAAQVDP